MERRFSFSAGVVGLAARVKQKQVAVADSNGTVSCVAVKASTPLYSFPVDSQCLYYQTCVHHYSFPVDSQRLCYQDVRAFLDDSVIDIYNKFSVW